MPIEMRKVTESSASIEPLSESWVPEGLGKVDVLKTALPDVEERFLSRRGREVSLLNGVINHATICFIQAET